MRNKSNGILPVLVEILWALRRSIIDFVQSLVSSLLSLLRGMISYGNVRSRAVRSVASRSLVPEAPNYLCTEILVKGKAYDQTVLEICEGVLSGFYN